MNMRGGDRKRLTADNLVQQEHNGQGNTQAGRKRDNGRDAPPASVNRTEVRLKLKAAATNRQFNGEVLHRLASNSEEQGHARDRDEGADHPARVDAFAED